MHDWHQTIQQATSSGAVVVRRRGSTALTYYHEVIASERPALKSLLAALSTKQIDQSTFTRELRVERRFMRAELEAHRDVGKDTARTASNVFFKMIGRGVRATVARKH